MDTETDIVTYVVTVGLSDGDAEFLTVAAAPADFEGLVFNGALEKLPEWSVGSPPLDVHTCVTAYNAEMLSRMNCVATVWDNAPPSVCLWVYDTGEQDSTPVRQVWAFTNVFGTFGHS